ncbi:MAG: hypothetical protein NC293_11845 [Roseburia sp.]|nr:hypothetical protein [Roseburia sp.]
MKKSLITRCLGKLLLSLLLTAGCLFFGAADTDAAADTVTVTLKSAGEDHTTYEMKELDSALKNVPNSAQVTFSIDQTDCVRFSYMHQINENESKGEYNSNFTLSGSQLKNYSEFTLEALCATPANTPVSATVKVMNGSVITSQVTYSVTVTPVAPRFEKKLSPQKIRTYVDELVLGDIENVSAGASVSIWASKPLFYRFNTTKYVGKKQKEVKTTKTKAISTTESAPTIITNLEPDDVEITDECIISKTSTGKINLYVVVKQDGKEYKKTYSFKATKYVNPFQSFSVKLKNGKNLQMAKLFNTRNTVANGDVGNEISDSQAKNMQGGRPYKIKMKKGFKITKIRYRKPYEWANMAKIRKWSESYQTLPKDFWEFYVYYKDKSGNTYKNEIYITMSMFPPQ